MTRHCPQLERQGDPGRRALPSPPLPGHCDEARWTDGRGGRQRNALMEGECESTEVSGEAPALAPSKHNKGLTEEECAARRPNPFCGHWRPSVRGTLMSHLIPGVDSPAPGPGRAPEMAWRLPRPWKAGQQAQVGRGGGGGTTPVLLQGQLSIYRGCGGHRGVSEVGSLAAITDLGHEFKAE